MKSTQIQAVFFDAAGTLIHLAQTVGEGYSQVAKRHGIELDPEATDRAFRIAWRSMPPMGSPLGEDGNRSEKHWWRIIVDRVLDSSPPDPPPELRDSYFEDLFESYADPLQWRLYPEVPEILGTLKQQGLRLFVLSNFDSRLLRILDGLGLSEEFEEVFYSGAIGHSKPSAQAFDHGLRSCGLSAAQCLHVGDDPEADWQGAANAGFQVFRLDRKLGDLRPLKNLHQMPDFSD